jgi:hypothetical protein
LLIQALGLHAPAHATHHRKHTRRLLMMIATVHFDVAPA